MGILALWVEDGIAAIQHEALLVQEPGWSLGFERTAEEALQAVAAKRFEAVILDLILPWDRYHQQRGGVAPQAAGALLEALRDLEHGNAAAGGVPVPVFGALVSPRL